MRIQAIGIAAALVLLGPHGTAVAQSRDPQSANRMMPGCREFANGNRNQYVQGVCVGVVRAMFYFGQSSLGICRPNGANVGQAVRVVIAYIDQRPERMHEVFEDLALEALQQAWPCRK